MAEEKSTGYSWWVAIISTITSLTVFSTIGAFLCYNYALTRIPATRAAVCLNGIPLITAFGAWIILGEKLSVMQLAGGIIVISAVYLANYSPRQQFLRAAEGKLK